MALAIGTFANGFGQQNVGVSLTNVAPLTNPIDISQLEIRGRLITQNSFLGTGVIPAAQQTGNFGTTARWNSLGNLNAGTQTLNGLRTQTNGRGLVLGYSINNSTSTLSNPFIQWIGNVTNASVQPGDLDFIVADNPGGPGVPASDRQVLRLKSNGKMVLGSNELGSNYLAEINADNGNLSGGLIIDVLNVNTNISPVGVSANVSGRGNSVGVFGTTSTDGRGATGVRGRSTGGAQFCFGVSGEGDNTAAVVRYGIYGAVATGLGGAFAGYFAGNVFATGTITGSDEKLKTNIEQEAGLEKLMKLKPVHYYYTKAAIADLKMPESFQHGFIAQDMEKVFPELVMEVKTPIFKINDKTGEQMVERIEIFKGINYTSIISVLTKSVQEQQQMIETLNQKIDQLQTANKTTAATSNGYTLSQNVPNPFTSNTIINYQLPANSVNAILAVFDLTGKMLLQYNLAKAANQISINGSSLAAGIYIYSLIVNGNEVVSKRMVLTK